MGFQKDFIWGTATAAYQIEGGAYAADKGLNVWDAGCRAGGYVYEGHTGDDACDTYHRFREDVAIMKQLGIKHFRMSLSWSRLIPNGIGEVSEEGVRFYNEFFDELLKNGITPWVTLFHWDYPYELYKKGGWLNEESPEWFEEYAQTVAKLFGDKITHFMTINEPQCFIELGHYTGVHAPFLKLSRREELIAAHNVLKANGLAERALRKNCKNPIKVGFAMAYAASMPYTEADEEAAYEHSFACHGDLFGTSFWTDPMILGRYPESYKQFFEENDFHPDERDMEIIKGNFDFFGVNSYTGNYVAVKDGKTQILPFPASNPTTDMRWHVTEEVMYYTPKFLYRRYGLPIVYTENGVAVSEWKDLDGEIKDYSRIDFIRRYLRELMRAAEEGIPVEGYFYWSLLDNFEWAEGYSKHFGLVHVDYDTFERTIKESAKYYAKVIETNGESIR